MGFSYWQQHNFLEKRSQWTSSHFWRCFTCRDGAKCSLSPPLFPFYQLWNMSWQSTQLSIGWEEKVLFCTGTARARAVFSLPVHLPASSTTLWGFLLEKANWSSPEQSLGMSYHYAGSKCPLAELKPQPILDWWFHVDAVSTTSSLYLWHSVVCTALNVVLMQYDQATPRHCSVATTAQV